MNIVKIINEAQDASKLQDAIAKGGPGSGRYPAGSGGGKHNNDKNSAYYQSGATDAEVEAMNAKFGNGQAPDKTADKAIIQARLKVIRGGKEQKYQGSMGMPIGERLASERQSKR